MVTSAAMSRKVLILMGWLALTAAAPAQVRPYIGYAYPAGGRQGTTFELRLGGQNLDEVKGVRITGSGVKAEVLETQRRLNPQEIQLLNEELRRLRRGTKAPAQATSAPVTDTNRLGPDADTVGLMAKIERRIREYVPLPANQAIASLVRVKVTIAADAESGERELRLIAARGVSNPLTFCIGQWPEFTRKPMITASKPVLGKEEQALRQRPPEEAEDRVSAPCTLNGQIASGEINRYRFDARKGQRLVIRVQARQLIPYLADAVPGWFQPVLVLYDANGREAAYDDDYRFNPDPTILYAVPRTGERVLEIYDSLYRGREDFVYRITLSEQPFITSIFPLGSPVGAPARPRIKGWNVSGAGWLSPGNDTGPGIHSLVAGRRGLRSNAVRFARDLLPDTFEKEPNNTRALAQKVTLPTIINGRIDKPGDWDVFQFSGRSNETIVAEVQARRLDSPLDSVLELTDARGGVLAFNDDHEDLADGLNTHQADSYFRVKLPADGAYYVHLGDAARQGGEEYAYRLRLSEPRPDFELRVVPSSVSLRINASAFLTVYAARKDGFRGPIKLELKDPPPGFSAFPVTLRATQTVARLVLRGPRTRTQEPIRLAIIGRARIGEQEIVHQAVAAEDRMQAFLWRHLVPASDLEVMVFDPPSDPFATRFARDRLPPTGATNTTSAAAPAKPRFTRQQILGRLRQLKLLFDDGLLTRDFYDEKVAECEAAP